MKRFNVEGLLSRSCRPSCGVLDPADRRAGLLDLKTPLTGSGEDVPLRDALAQLLNPVKMSFEVRDEVIVLKYKAQDR